LRAAGFQPEVVSPKVAELSGESGLVADQLVLENARLKGKAAFDAGTVAGVVIIAADTVVELEGRIFGKPETEQEAVTMLQQLAGKAHRVLTGVWMAWRRGLEEDVFEEWVERTEVLFHARGEEFIRAYVKRVESLDKAGGYAAQSDQGEMIAEVRGSFSSVIGLPIERVTEVLQRWGLNPSGITVVSTRVS
jgi:septum formation protein